MVKVTKNICLRKESEELIDKMHKEEGFNFSAWVEEKFDTEFRNSEKIEKSKEFYKKKLEELERLEEEKNKRVFSEDEINFFKNVPKLLRRGCDVKALNNRFNIEFKKELSLTEFKTEVKKQEIK